MTNLAQTELERVRAALAGLEAQRGLLGEAIVEPALAALRRQLADLEAQPGIRHPPTHAEERRIVTILFADVVGSTSLAEQMDPEDWREVIAAVHQMAGQLIQQHDGAVLQYQGDGLLALFGDRASDERDPENAIRAGLAIQAELASRKGSLLYNGLPGHASIQMRVGIHTGLVVLGDIGSQAKREFTALGDAMNLASRLQSSAPAGGVLISHDTYRHVRGVFDVAAQPPLTVKGKLEPVQSYLVYRAKPRPFRATTRGVAGVETRTIGREAEQQQLQAAVTAAVAGRQVVWAQLVGEAGVGKTRLLGDTADYLELRPEVFRWLRGRAFQGDERQPFSLVRRMWFDRFQIAEDAPIADAEAHWMEQFKAYGASEEDEAAQALGLLVGLSFAGSPSPHLRVLREDPAQLKGLAYVVSRDLLAAMRAETPIAVLLEDLHWVDASSWDYLVQVILNDGDAGAVSPHGLVVLGTARPEWNPPEVLCKTPGYQEIPLQPLSEDASRILAQALLRHVQGVPKTVVDLIVDRSEGVPYFVEEMVNWFIDRGIIDTHATPWHFVPAHLNEQPLPATLQHLLLTRLGALNDAERAVLQRGSIFGRHFWEGGLEALNVHEGNGVLTRLQPRGFVDQQPDSTLAGDTEWGFHHNLLHQVTYESVLRRERKELHKAAAVWLEQQAQKVGRLDEFVGAIGDHAERAGELAAAADWYLRAGHRARVRGAFVEAQQYYARVSELAPESDLQRRWHALLGQNDVLRMLGDNQAYSVTVGALLDIAQQLDDQHLAEALYRQGYCMDSSGDYRAALRTYEMALALARRTGNRILEATLLALMAISQNRLGEAEIAAGTAQAALACAAQLGEAIAVKALNNVAVYFVEAGDLARALQLHREQAMLNQRLGDRAGEANALANLGYDCVCLGLFEEGSAALEQSIRLSRAIGMRRELAYSQLNLALARWRSGDDRAARQVLEELDNELVAMGDSFARAAGKSYSALVMEQSGDYARAALQFGEAKDRLELLGVRGYAIDALAGIARCEFAQGHWAEARRIAATIWDSLQRHGAAGMEFPIWAYVICADCFERAGEQAYARAAADAGYRELMQRAEKISDSTWCRSFMENVPEHRAIAALWQRLAVQ
ncbi:MAG: AAA family ATPase [Chloroflexi bacterium]|nr:AAA family ATPase [Chloroflexota bacterium]